MPKTLRKREELIDQVIDLVMMGYDKPYHVQKAISEIATWPTAKSYLDEAKRRINKKYAEDPDRENVLKKEIADLKYMEQKSWEIYAKSNSYNERTGAMRTILSIKERRAKLLGLDVNNLNVTGNVGLNLAEISRIVAEQEKETDDGVTDNAPAEGSEPSESN